jgi:hypothetical protein
VYKSNRFLSIDDLLAMSEKQPNGCYVWLGRKDADGYGRFKVNNKVIGVHRRVAILAFGEPQLKQVAMHSCDNPSCINPQHLSWGTVLDNQRDKVSKNRQAKGRNHGRTKFSQTQVDAIVAMKLNGATNSEILSKYSIDKSTIYRLLKEVK